MAVDGRPCPHETASEDPMAEIMQHLTALADEIGPRPATSDAESRAADYIKSVFIARGLEPEVQEFDAPRTYSWAYVIYYLLTIVSAVVAGIKPDMAFLTWGAFVVSAAVAIFFWLDLDTRPFGLTRLMPKGPSQNVIARHVPKSRRGEKLKKIVIVAHYDTARSSLAFSPSMVRQFPVTFGLMKAATFLTPVLILAMATPWTAKAEPYLWYATMVVAAYLLIPLVINVQRELMMPFVDGANDNASGVAAMLGVLNNLVSEPDASRFSTSQFEPTVRSVSEAFDADVVPDGALLSYSPAGPSRDAASDLPDDFQWAETSSAPERQPQRGQGLLEFDTIDFAAVGPDDARTSSADAPRSQPPIAREEPPRVDLPTGPDTLPGAGAPLGAVPTEEPRKKRGLLGGLGLGKKKKEEPADVKGWLGVDDEFDARKAGADIGSWDKFGSDDDDDDAGGLGWKGGCGRRRPDRR